jgi:hypothetical protein
MAEPFTASSLVATNLKDILAQEKTPCLSLYQPMYRSPPEQGQNRIRYENLLKRLAAALHEQLGTRGARQALGPLTALLENNDFLKPNCDGLAVLASPGFLAIRRLPRSVPEIALAADSFHLRPLIRVLQATDRFHVLGISEKAARLWEGNRDALLELEPGDGVPRTIFEALPEEFTDPTLPPDIEPTSRAGFGGPVVHAAPRSRIDSLGADMHRFFRVVDRAMTVRYSQRAPLPLILAALPQHHAAFRQESRNPCLLDTAIDGDPFALTPDELRLRAWQIIEPSYVARLNRLRDEFHAARQRGQAADDLADLAQAAVQSRVRTLLIDAAKEQKGRIDAATGAVDCGAGAGDDVFDDLAELVLRRGGEVLMVPAEHMPTTTGAAGIFRF